MIKYSIFGQKPWTNRLGKFWFFWTFFKNLCIIQNTEKRSFLAWFAQKTQMIKCSIFWHKEKRWTNTFGKFRFFWTFLKRILSYPQYQKTIFSRLICPKPQMIKNSFFLTKTMDLWKISIIWSFLKLPFSGLKSNLFYPKHKKRSFLTWFAQNTKMIKHSIFWLAPQKNWLISSLKIVIFYREH